MQDESAEPDRTSSHSGAMSVEMWSEMDTVSLNFALNLISRRNFGGVALRSNHSIEQAAIERSAWLAHLRAALDVAERTAEQLVVSGHSASEALDLLARLALIRGELDRLQRRTPQTRDCPITPNRIDPSQWLA